ncbi:MAG: 2'-5' RNA ligase family protein, partial [Patescibacteria group bacterium]
SRFWSSLSPDELSEAVKPLFQATQPIELSFGEAAILGPKQVAVHLVENSSELEDLHAQLHDLLNATGVTYTAPQFVGNGHKPHVSKREDDQFSVGHKQMANAAYLIEVEIKGEEHLRHIRAKFDLKG